MKGLELSKRYFEAYGRTVLEKDFKEAFPYIAVGLVGSGSECFGYDDDSSTDHDFEPSFCIFIPNDRSLVDDKTEHLLEKNYLSLPNEFEGYRRQGFGAAGAKRHGVIRIGDFYSSKTGTVDGKLSLEQWISIPEFYLAEATNGQVFLDNYGEFSTIRKRLTEMPDDVRLKKLAGNFILAAQNGEYNYLRCISHRETAAAQLTLFNFENAVCNIVFLLNKRYQPYFKWKHRAMRELRDGEYFSENLEYLISSPNDYDTIDSKLNVIKSITNKLLSNVKTVFPDLEKENRTENIAFLLNDKINDVVLRTENILYAINN